MNKMYEFLYKTGWYMLLLILVILLVMTTIMIAVSAQIEIIGNYCGKLSDAIGSVDFLMIRTDCFITFDNVQWINIIDYIRPVKFLVP